ncbi:MAG: dienelactone hydrolase family protein [bacterium]
MCLEKVMDCADLSEHLLGPFQFSACTDGATLYYYYESSTKFRFGAFDDRFVAGCWLRRSFQSASNCNSRDGAPVRHTSRAVPYTLLGLALVTTAACATLSRGTEVIWLSTRVYFPNTPRPAVRVQDAEFTEMSAARVRRRQLPTVIFLHGCTGFTEGYSQASYPRGLAEAGFVVFVPDSFARPDRVRVCGNIRIDTVELRREEVAITLEQIRKLPWVDQRNLFLAGHSEGGIATAMYGGGEFNAYYIAGWTCRSRNPDFDRLHIPARKPVLSIVGDTDPYYIARGRGHCGERFGPWVGKGSRAVVLKGIGHEVTDDPATLPTLIEFFRANLKPSS